MNAHCNVRMAWYLRVNTVHTNMMWNIAKHITAVKKIYKDPHPISDRALGMSLILRESFFFI